jgi:hypothetical protein
LFGESGGFVVVGGGRSSGIEKVLLPDSTFLNFEPCQEVGFWRRGSVDPNPFNSICRHSLSALTHSNVHAVNILFDLKSSFVAPTTLR